MSLLPLFERLDKKFGLRNAVRRRSDLEVFFHVGWHSKI
jgi:hypothetical protein